MRTAPTISLLAISIFVATPVPGQAQTAQPDQRFTPTEIVDSFNAVFGKQQPGIRANHAKGVDLQGVFTPSASAASVSKAPHFQKTAVPIDVRFSNFGGNPKVSDSDPQASARGMSIKFHLPGGSETDLVSHSYNGFPVRTADDLHDFMMALATTGPGETKPTPLDDFLYSHPAAKTFLEGQIPPPLSYGTVSYFGVNTFKFTNADGAVIFGRFQIRPEAGDHSLPKDRVASADRNYLSTEIRERLAHGPVRFTLLLQIAEKGDNLDDPTVAWPDTRAKVELGTIEINQAVADNATAERKLLFLPTRLPAGIEPEDPMLKARTDAYVVSFGRRSSQNSAAGQ